MSEKRKFPENNAEGGPPPRVEAEVSRAREERSALVHDRWFRRAWAASVFLHAVLFVWVSMAPSQPKYRFFGSGTAVSLVGADEIPGGAARGKSGDRPEDVEAPAKGARKIVVPQKRSASDEKKRILKQKSPPRKLRRIVKKSGEGKKRAVRKKRRDLAREARLERIRVRRERERRWRSRYEKRKSDATRGARSPKKKNRPPADRMRDNRLAKADLASRSRGPLKGYLGSGGGDGQGGGSLGGGGVARSEMERYYGLLARRIRNHWTLPLSLSNVSKMRASVSIDVSRRGGHRNLRIVRTSGNRIYDQAALRAVKRASKPTLPSPPDTAKEKWLLLGFRFCGKRLGC